MGIAALLITEGAHHENRFDGSGRILHHVFMNLADNSINRGNEAEAVGWTRRRLLKLPESRWH